MTATAREQIGELLSEVGAAGSFTARRTRAADDLHLEVKGLGRLRFPISPAQSKRLCRIARPGPPGARSSKTCSARDRRGAGDSEIGLAR